MKELEEGRMEEFWRLKKLNKFESGIYEDITI